MHYFEVRFPEVLMDEGTSFSEAIDDALNEMPVEIYEWLGGGRTRGGDGTDLYLEIGGPLKCILDVFVHTLRNAAAPPDTVLYVAAHALGVTDRKGKTYRLGDLARGI